jgi:hypothetical protein
MHIPIPNPFIYPSSIKLLLLASIWGYERVHFDGVPLPFVFELIAWISMAGPLLVVPGVALWYVIEVLRRNKVLWLKSPFSLC